MQRILRLIRTETARDAATMTVGTGFAALAAAVFFIIVARLGPEVLGTFSLATAAFLMFSDVFDIALNASLVRFVASAIESKSADAEKYLKFIFKTKVAIGITALSVAVLFASPLSRLLFTRQMPAVLMLIGMGIGFQLLFTFGLAHFQARKQFVKAAKSTVLLPLIRLFGLLMLVALDRLTPLLILGVYFLATPVAATFTILSAPRAFLKERGEKEVAKTFLKYNLPLTAGFALAAVSGRIDNFILANLSGPAAVGFYSAAFRLFTPLQILAGSLSTVFAPRFAGFDTPQKARAYLGKATLAVGTMSLGLFALFPFSPLLIRIIFGSQYLPSVPALRILFFGFAIFLLQAPFTSTTLFYLGKSRIFAVISGIQLLLIVIANLILIPRFEQVGAALAFVLTQCAVLALLATYVIFSLRRKEE